jgi:hypothetical protein
VAQADDFGVRDRQIIVLLVHLPAMFLFKANITP